MTADGPGDPTPAATPVPAGQCPHCQGFLWVVLRARPPVALPPRRGVEGPLPGTGECPHCRKAVWFGLRERPALASPAEPRATALLPLDPRRVTTLKHLKRRRD